MVKLSFFSKDADIVFGNTGAHLHEFKFNEISIDSRFPIAEKQVHRLKYKAFVTLCKIRNYTVAAVNLSNIYAYRLLQLEHLARVIEDLEGDLIIYINAINPLENAQILASYCKQLHFVSKFFNSCILLRSQHIYANTHKNGDIALVYTKAIIYSSIVPVKVFTKLSHINAAHQLMFILLFAALFFADYSLFLTGICLIAIKLLSQYILNYY
jgi:hypothetical protein